MQNNIKSTQDEISTIERRLTDISEEKQELKTKIEIAEKQHTEDELIEEAQEELKNLNRRESSLNIRLIETRQRLSELNEKRRMLSEILPSIEEIESSIGENLKIAEIEAIITQQIEALEKSVTDERYILDRLIDIEIENKELNQENEQIIARLGSIPQDKTDFEKYKKYIRLCEQAEAIEQEQSSKSKYLEVLSEAQILMKDIIFELSQHDDVKYFINLETIENNKEEKEIIHERLQEIPQTKDKIEKLKDKMAINRANPGKKVRCQ